MTDSPKPSEEDYLCGYYAKWTTEDCEDNPYGDSCHNQEAFTGFIEEKVCGCGGVPEAIEIISGINFYESLWKDVPTSDEIHVFNDFGEDWGVLIRRRNAYERKLVGREIPFRVVLRRYGIESLYRYFGHKIGGESND